MFDVLRLQQRTLILNLDSPTEKVLLFIVCSHFMYGILYKAAEVLNQWLHSLQDASFRFSVASRLFHLFQFPPTMNALTYNVNPQRVVNGIMNRLSEDTLEPVTARLKEAYRGNSTTVVNEALWQSIRAVCIHPKQV